MTDKNQTEPNFPTYDCTDALQLYHDLISTHEPDEFIFDDYSEVSISHLVLSLMADIPVFNPSMIYDILFADITRQTVNQILSRHEKRGLVKSTPVHSKKIKQNVYYLTKTGYQTATFNMSCCVPYQPKTGKRIGDNAIHDYGVSCAYLSFVRSPFMTRPSYEVTYSFDKNVMPEEKYMRRSLRPDAVFAIYTPITTGTVYIEHDTGKEIISVMVHKLKQYFDHSLLNHRKNVRNDYSDTYHQDCLIFTFRLVSFKTPHCFSPLRLNKLLDSMTDDERVEDVKDASFRRILSDLEKWTDAFGRHWTKPELDAFAKRVNTKTEPSERRYLKIRQRLASARRRDSALSLLLDEYRKGRDSDYYGVIREMLRGFPVCFAAYNNLDVLLPFLYIEDYPQLTEWLKKALRPYYGNITYVE